MKEPKFVKRWTKAADKMLDKYETFEGNAFSGADVLPSPIHGHGLFSKFCFFPGDLVIFEPGMLVPLSEIGRRGESKIEKYNFVWDGDHILVSSMISYTNHAKFPNARALIVRRPVPGILLFAAALIEKDDEILIHYEDAPGKPFSNFYEP